jgi:hypothetical protein
MKLRTVIATATTAAVLASGGVAIAGATGNSTPSSSPTSQSTTAPAASAPAAAPLAGRVAGPRFLRFRARRLARRALIRREAADVITKTLGIDQATLRSGLAAGQTIGQIATAHGSTPQAVIDALVAATTTKLNAAVTAHEITPERAAKIEAKLPARVARLVNDWHPKRLRNATTS